MNRTFNLKLLIFDLTSLYILVLWAKNGVLDENFGDWRYVLDESRYIIMSENLVI